MAKRTAKQIVEAKMPGMEVVETPPVAHADSVRRGLRPGPSIAELRKKYLGGDVEEEEVEGEGTQDAQASAPSNDAQADIEIVTVRPKRTSSDPAEDPGVRAVIVSKKKGLLGSQG